MPEDHHTILSASENLNAAVKDVKEAVARLKLTREGRELLNLHFVKVESVALFLDSKAKHIAETQP